jgi:pimeloyl-ACP methyl ester carboxylesterase
MPRAESVVLGGLDVVRVRATGPPRPASLLFVHGMWGGAWVWERWLPFFAARGWDGYALNLRGRAGSRPVADIGRVPFAAYVEDAAAAARRLGDVVVVGHSMGGLVAQALAAQLDPLAAVAVTPAAPRGIWALRSAGLVLATLRYAPALVRSRPLLPSRRVMMRLALGGLPAPERDAVYRKLVPESARQARDIALRGVAVDASAVHCPMLVVAGGDDRLTPSSVVRRVARRYSATLYEYHGLGHMVPLEPRWQDVAGDVAAWLAAHESDRQPFASERQEARACSQASGRSYDDDITSLRSHQCVG